MSNNILRIIRVENLNLLNSNDTPICVATTAAENSHTSHTRTLRLRYAGYEQSALLKTVQFYGRGTFQYSPY